MKRKKLRAPQWADCETPAKIRNRKDIRPTPLGCGTAVASHARTLGFVADGRTACMVRAV